MRAGARSESLRDGVVVIPGASSGFGRAVKRVRRPLVRRTGRPEA